MLKQSPPRKLLICLVAFILVAFSPLKIIALIAVLLGLAHFLPLKVNFFSKLVIAYLLFFAFNTLLAGITYLLDTVLPVEILLAVQVLVVGWLLNTSAKTRPLRDFRITRTSVISLVLFMGLFAIIALPTLRGSHFAVIRSVTFGGDNVSHIELLNAVKDRGGYFYEKPALTGAAMTENLASYPQGFHFNMHVVMDSIKPLFDLEISYKRLVGFYYLYTLALFLLFAWAFIIAVQTTRDIPSKGALVSGIAAAAVLFSGLFYSLFALGFQTQIASSALFLGMLIFLQQMFVSSNLHDKKQYALLAFLMLVGISFTWLFPLPVAMLVFAICFIFQFYQSLLKNLSKNSLFLAGCIGLGIMALVQPIVQALNHTSRTEGINEIGFTVRPNTLIVTALTAAALGIILILFNKVKTLWTVAIVSSILFSLFIYVYQWSRVGEARYYYYKSLFLLIMLAVVALAAAAGKMVDQATGQIHFRGVVLSCFLVAAGALSIYNFTNPTDFFRQQKGGGFSPELAATAISLIEDNPSNGKKIIAVGSCNRANDYTASRLVAVLTGEYDLVRQGLVSSELNPDRLSLLKAIKYYQKVKSPELIIISGDYPLQTYIQQALNDNYGKETFIDLDFGHIPKPPAACPHLVR